MSKIGKKPVLIPAGVEVNLNDDKVEVKGKGGVVNLPFLSYLKGNFTKKENEGSELVFSITNNSKQARANWGTMASLVRGAVEGVTNGFSKNLEIEGIGFKASMSGSKLILNVGFTHPIELESPSGIKIAVEKNIIKVSGIDKALVGQVAANIRKVKKPEPYQGKGIRYQGEVVRRKAGKKAATAGAVG
jgi:large subunit ribosomal protein L6